MEFSSFEELLVSELQDLYSAENQIIESLTKTIKEVSSPELRECLQHHLQETKNQIVRLEKAFAYLEVGPGKEVCKAMVGLSKELSEILKSQSKSLLKDAAIIGALQKVEHYEIAGYGTASSHAKMLDFDEVLGYLQETLKEETNADKKLSKIAEGSFFTDGINKKATNVRKTHK